MWNEDYQSRLSLLRPDDRWDSGIFVVFVRLPDIGYRKHVHTLVVLLFVRSEVKGILPGLKVMDAQTGQV